MKYRQELIILQEKLSPYNISQSDCYKILNEVNSIDEIEQNPYLMSPILSFPTTDKIALTLYNVSANNINRLEYAILYVLETEQNNGNLYGIKGETIATATKILGNNDIVKITKAFELLKEKKAIIEKSDIVYLKKNLENENVSAKMLIDFSKKKPVLVPEKKVRAGIQESESYFNVKLSESQKQAVINFFTHSLSIITGGAGTGKTTVLKVIIRIIGAFAKNDNTSFLLTAPTGKASRRITESTGAGAMTIHKALELRENNDTVQDIDCTTFVIDEFSMVDMDLMYKIMMATTQVKHILLLGDEEQLPSVGAGNVLRQLLVSNQLCISKLDVTYRQGKESMIIHNATNIRNEVKEIIYNDTDFQILDSSNPETILDKCKDLYKTLYSTDVCVLAPKKAGLCGVYNLNNELREIANPKSAIKKEIKYKDYIFRLGDKVMQIKNTDTLSNGDCGIVTSILSNSKLQVTFEDDSIVEYDNSSLATLIPAFAMTIHKSQGSEYKNVIIVLCEKEARNMIKKNLVYTAITRAKQNVYIVGDKDSVLNSISRNKDKERRTFLAKRLNYYQKLYNA